MKTIFHSFTALATALLALAAGVASGQTGTKYGAGAMPNTTTGYSSAFGNSALAYNNSYGTHNTALGYQTLMWNSSGKQNTAAGIYALRGNNTMTGVGDTALGAWALYLNTTGSYATANGYRSLYNNSGGAGNTALGPYCLYANTVGGYNTAMGFGGLDDNLTGSYNVAVGNDVMAYKTTGSCNTALGEAANRAGGDGAANVAHGMLCLQTVEGDQNTGFGVQVMTGGHGCMWNTGIGVQALMRSTGRGNIGIGELAGYYLDSGNDNIDIGSYGRAGDNATIRIGEPQLKKDAFFAGVHGATVPSGVRVLVNSDGKLGTLTSSRKFKQDIADMAGASDVLRKLRPVTFRYKPELDSEGIPQFGLIAEEVAEISPDLVARDANGEIYTVRYESVNAMLLNEFQKQHHRVAAHDERKQGQARRLADQEHTLAEQQKQLQALAQSVAELKVELNGTSSRID